MMFIPHAPPPLVSFVNHALPTVETSLGRMTTILPYPSYEAGHRIFTSTFNNPLPLLTNNGNGTTTYIEWLLPNQQGNSTHPLNNIGLRGLHDTATEHTMFSVMA
jgi:hypothetical protein